MDVHPIVAALRRLAPPGVRTGARIISPADLDLIDAAERAVVANAVGGRQCEFATGRVLLHDLLGSDRPILITVSRAPLWPSGTTGSLAHDRSIAVAAVSRRASVVAVGIDVEPNDELPAEMARVILRDDERGIDAHLAFSLKEAAYKAWSSIGGRQLEHHDVRVELAAADADALAASVGSHRFTATVVSDGVCLNGRWTMVDDRYLALVVVDNTRGSEQEQAQQKS